MPRTAVTSISPLPASSPYSSTMIVTACHVGCTMSRRIPNRMTLFCLCAADTAGTCADTRTPAVFAISESTTL